MIVFGEPLEPVKLPGRPRKRTTGWHKKSAATWEARQRAAKNRPKIPRKRIGFTVPDIEPCPKCYAPMRDGVCTGRFHSMERLGA